MGTHARLGQHTLDTLQELKATGLVAASAAHPIVDLGSDAILHGDIEIDVSAIETATGDELYTLILLGSDSATFASGIEELACIRLGHSTPAAATIDVDSDAGRYVTPFTNDSNGRRYRYIRLYTLVVGTIATGINFTAQYGIKTR